MQLQLLYELHGQVDAREVLRPNAHGPRMRIGCSGSVHGSGKLGAFGGAMHFDFVANPRVQGFYGWKGRGIGFGSGGPAFIWRGSGTGERGAEGFVYRGAMRLQAVSPELHLIDALACAFEYRQYADSARVQLACHALTS
ncbi:MAG: hypothetical protein JSR41_09545 [Proteobacteria bacterium]|nr:hypothetical protein [Pseudomonadota bacterium]